jgi:hypothetical protein
VAAARQVRAIEASQFLYHLLDEVPQFWKRFSVWAESNGCGIRGGRRTSIDAGDANKEAREWRQ